MIIMLTGRKRSGKDEAAKVLINNHGFIRYAFADPIKAACKVIFMLDEEQLDGSTKEIVDPRWGMTPREMYQYVGTELFRVKLPELSAGFNAVVGDTLWVTRFVEWYRAYGATVKDVVITDLRFENELFMVAGTFGAEVVSIRIERDGVDKSDMHASETAIDSLPVAYTVKNDGTIKELHAKIEAIYDYHKDKIAHLN